MEHPHILFLFANTEKRFVSNSNVAVFCSSSRAGLYVFSESQRWSIQQPQFLFTLRQNRYGNNFT